MKAPAESARAILDAGAESVRKIVSPGNLNVVLAAYNVAVTDTFVSCNLSTF